MFSLTLRGLVVAFLGLTQVFISSREQGLAQLSMIGNDLDPWHGAILSPILVPRVSGTVGSFQARQHIISLLRNELPNWKITTQRSSSKVETPMGNQKVHSKVTFYNIIATRVPPRGSSIMGRRTPRRLTLVAHYDSKYGDKPVGETWYFHDHGVCWRDRFCRTMGNHLACSTRGGRSNHSAMA